MSAINFFSSVTVGQKTTGSVNSLLSKSKIIFIKISPSELTIFKFFKKVFSKGKVLLDEEPTPVEQINKIVGRKLRENNRLIVSVKAHPKTSYSDYVRVIDQLKMADAKRISIANSQ